MKTRTKIRSKRILGSAMAVAMAGTFAATGLGSLSALAYTDADGLYYSDFSSFEDLLAYEKDYSIQLEAESIVLMKNENEALPLTATETNVSLFGNISYASLMKKNGNNDTTGFTMLPEALQMAGFKLNPRVQSVYEVYGPQYTSKYASNNSGIINGRSTQLSNAIRTELPTSLFETTEGSYQFYGDAAIYTIGREGNEDVDIAMSDTVSGEHALKLDENEKAMIKYLGQNFKKVIVLVNVAASMDLAELEDDPNVDAIVWIGIPGQYGMEAVGQVLNGTVNPSGRTTSIYASDLTKSPAYQNYVTNAELIATALDGEGEVKTNALSIQYEEDIYVGYKWYETAAADGVLKELDNYDETQDTWTGSDEYYNRSTGVVYPFGYGLSYTEFEQKLVTESFAIPANATLDTFIDVQVEVKNVGSVAGKEVVQLYAHAPYTTGGIEKAEVSLVSFAKTGTLKPGQSEVVTLSVRVGDLASFDYNDANDNEYKGYELEAGAYELRLQKNSHEVIETLAFDVTTGLKLDNDGDATNNTPLSEGDIYDSLLVMEEKNSTMKLMSRADFVNTFPTTPDKETVVYSDDLMALFGETTNRYSNYYTPDLDETTDPWYVASVPTSWTQAADTSSRTNGKTAIQLIDLKGVDYWDTTTKVTVAGEEYASGAAAWEAYLNQLTWDELVALCSSGGFGTIANESIGKPVVNDGDGPENYGDDATYFPSSLNQAATWNVELTYLHGVISANEAMYIGKQGWYAPSFNILRCPFGGRGRSYYSEDGILSAYIAASTIAGAESMGVHAFAKHLALNEQETGRNGLVTWASEQAIRELYLKPFEYSLKVGEHFGGAGAIMTAMNRVGAIASCGNYALLTEIVRGEWNFHGLIITDSYNSAWAKASYMQRAGCDLPLGSFTIPSETTDFSKTNAIAGTWDAEKNTVVYDGVASPTQWTVIRNSVTRELWYTVNSQAMANGLDTTLFTEAFDGQEYDVNAGVTTSIDLAVEDYGASLVLYSIVDGALPDGLAIDASGHISGIATETGTFVVTIRQLGCGWVPSDATITIKVDPLFSSTAGWSATAGEAFSSTLSQDVYEAAENIAVEGRIGSVTVEMIGEVPGLTFDSETGVLSGTPTEAGVYNFTLRLSYTITEKAFDRDGTPMGYDDEGNLKWARQSSPIVIETSYTFTVAEGSADNGDAVKSIVSAAINDNGELVITYSDGETQNLGKVVGADGTNGADGKDASGSGCGSAIGAGSAAVALAIVGVGVAGIIAIRRRKNQEE